MLTNFREAAQTAPRTTPPPPSRGALPLGFLRASDSTTPLQHLRALHEGSDGHEASLRAYDACNLLCGDTRSGDVAVLGNRGAGGPRAVPPGGGAHALSNGAFGDEWPKVAHGRERFAALLAGWPPGTPLPVQALLGAPLLADVASAAGVADEQLPRTGVSLECERGLASICVAMPDLAGGGRCADC